LIDTISKFKYLGYLLCSNCCAHDIIAAFTFFENIIAPMIPTITPETIVIAKDNGSVCRRLGNRFCTTVRSDTPNKLSKVSVSIGESRI
jgi:hypothetical protein